MCIQVHLYIFPLCACALPSALKKVCNHPELLAASTSGEDGGDAGEQPRKWMPAGMAAKDLRAGEVEASGGERLVLFGSGILQLHIVIALYVMRYANPIHDAPTWLSLRCTCNYWLSQVRRKAGHIRPSN